MADKNDARGLALRIIDLARMGYVEEAEQKILAVTQERDALRRAAKEMLRFAEHDGIPHDCQPDGTRDREGWENETCIVCTRVLNERKEALHAAAEESQPK